MKIAQETYQSVKYALGLTIFYPDAEIYPKPRPAVVYFFGSGWHNGSTVNQYKIAEAYAEDGFTVFLPDYSTAVRHNSTAFNSVDDAVAAWRHIRANCARYGVSEDRLVLAGGSSGGQLALMAGISDVMPACFVLYNPAVDDILLERSCRSALPRDYREISPFERLSAVNGFAPSVIFHGEGDRTVPCEAAVKFHDRAVSRGFDCELHTYPDCDHGFYHPVFPGKGEYFHDVIGKSLAFIKCHI